jgi:hypothetical protein
VSDFDLHTADGLPSFDFTDLGLDVNGAVLEFQHTDNYYGLGHGDACAKLTQAILATLGPKLDNHLNRSALWVAGLFHDIGRTEPFGKEDPYHAARGADMVERILRGHHELHGDELLRSVSCRLIALHDRPPDDPVAQVLWDADHWEACRYMPGTPDGLKVLKERTSPHVLYTDFAKERANLRRYMSWRGWR